MIDTAEGYAQGNSGKPHFVTASVNTHPSSEAEMFASSRSLTSALAYMI